MGSPMLEAMTTVKAEASSIVKPLQEDTGRCIMATLHRPNTVHAQSLPRRWA